MGLLLKFVTFLFFCTLYESSDCNDNNQNQTLSDQIKQLKIVADQVKNNNFHNHNNELGQESEKPTSLISHNSPLSYEVENSKKKDDQSIYSDLISIDYPLSESIETHTSKIPEILNKATIACIVIYKTGKYLFGKRREYNLKTDVLDIPYKNMVYRHTREIEYHLKQASNTENIPLAIKSILKLFSTPVPEWYKDKFEQGLKALLKECFDANGNFCYDGKLPNTTLLFKKYLKKAPKDWVGVAAIHEEWYKDKPAQAITNQYADLITNKHNKILLKAIEKNELEDLPFLKNIELEYKKSNAIQTVYDYNFKKILTNNSNEFGFFRYAYQDPLWKNMSLEAQSAHSHDKELNEILIMRYVKAQKSINHQLLLRANMKEELLDSIYNNLPCNSTIFKNQNNIKFQGQDLKRVHMLIIFFLIHSKIE